MRITRRDWMRAAGAAMSSAAALPLAWAQDAAKPRPIARRKLGRIGFEASIYALGTAEIPADDEAVSAIELALDGGVNYIDTAPSYQSTRSERAIGSVAKRRRTDFFLASKTLARDADGAFAEVRASRERLQCETIDLLQVHAVNDEEALRLVLRDNGAVKGLERARAEGWIRHIGITGHTRPEVLAKALEAYPFESILVPLSAADRHVHDFAAEVVPAAVAKGLAVLGMKSLKGLELHAGRIDDAEPFVRYSLSLPISSLTIGFRRRSDIERNLTIASRFEPLTKEEMERLAASVEAWASADVLWWKRRG